MSFQAGCPACGAPVSFKTGSGVVVVCEFCHSVVARTDKGLEDVGRVADVAESGSPLRVGLRGAIQGAGFELTGRAQLGHGMGGTWDEWYAAFDDGRWGWLAEAQGRFYLTFQRQISNRIPPFAKLELGKPVQQIPTKVPLVVTEKGEARAVAAEGEIPYRLVPGETYSYADLSGLGGAFGTIDYGESPPAVFVGREVTLDELGFAHLAPRERGIRVVGASQLNCPQCGGPLELRAPDQTERVTCPNCGSLLDVNQGQLSYLRTLDPGPFRPTIPIGSAAEFEGHRQTVIGFMVRSVEFEGVRYNWQEYLLYEPKLGFRWLVESDGHWSYVRPVPPGEVTEPNDRRAVYRGKSFKIFQNADARVEYVAGEFYWKVEAGETVRAVDFISPPDMLSKEISGEPVVRGEKRKKEKFMGAGEINWSLGTYVPLKEIERKFNVDLPFPQTVAPNQPFPHKNVYGYWFLLVFLAVLACVVMLVVSPRRTVFNESYRLQATAAPSPTPNVIQLPGGRTMTIPMPALPQTSGENVQVIFSEPFEIRGGQNLRITGEANVDNNWLYVAGDLINEETGMVQQFDLPIEYYYGVDGGESWSEGGRDETAYLSALPAGTYTMRLEAQWENWPQTPQLTVRVQQGVPRLLNVLLVLLALSAIPLLIAILHAGFEKRRWGDSEYGP